MTRRSRDNDGGGGGSSSSSSSSSSSNSGLAPQAGSARGCFAHQRRQDLEFGWRSRTRNMVLCWCSDTVAQWEWWGSSKGEMHHNLKAIVRAAARGGIGAGAEELA